MRTMVLDCLPIPDPAEEAHAIVRAGFGLEHRRVPPIVHTLVDHERGIRFVSPEQAEWERQTALFTAEWRFGRNAYALPHRLLAGIDEA